MDRDAVKDGRGRGGLVPRRAGECAHALRMAARRKSGALTGAGVGRSRILSDTGMRRMGAAGS
jgi:hypothetical protein